MSIASGDSCGVLRGLLVKKNSRFMHPPSSLLLLDHFHIAATCQELAVHVDIQDSRQAEEVLLRHDKNAIHDRWLAVHHTLHTPTKSKQKKTGVGTNQAERRISTAVGPKPSKIHTLHIAPKYAT